MPIHFELSREEAEVVKNSIEALIQTRKMELVRTDDHHLRHAIRAEVERMESIDRKLGEILRQASAAA